MKEDTYTTTPQDAARYEGQRDDFADERPDRSEYIDDESDSRECPPREGQVQALTADEIRQQLRDFLDAQQEAERA